MDKFMQRDIDALVSTLNSAADAAQSIKSRLMTEPEPKPSQEYEFISFLDESGLPLGLRNNNPGNLRKSKDLWRGELPDPQNKGKGFERYKFVEYGIRANAIDIIGDIKKDGNDTIEKLINTYAPEHENDTKAYIKFVCNQLGLTFNEKITVTYESIAKLLDAIYHMELGANYAVKISQEMIAKGVSMINSGAKRYLDA